jgi:hypothetical protein
LVNQGEAKPLKGQAEIAGGVGLKEPAVGIAFLVVCIGSVRGNRDQEPPIHLHAALNGECRIEQIGGINVHEHGTAEHPIKLAIEWLAEIGQRPMLNPSCKLGVDLLGQLNELRCGIHPKCFKALPVQLGQVAARPTANVQNLATGREDSGEVARQWAWNILIALGHRMRVLRVVAKGGRVHGLLEHCDFSLRVNF